MNIFHNQSEYIFSNFLSYSISVSCLGLGHSDLDPGFEEKPGLSDRRERLLRKITRNPGRHLHNGVISWILAKPAPTLPVLSLLIINIKEPVKQIIMDHNWTIKNPQSLQGEAGSKRIMTKPFRLKN